MQRSLSFSFLLIFSFSLVDMSVCVYLLRMQSCTHGCKSSHAPDALLPEPWLLSASFSILFLRVAACRSAKTSTSLWPIRFDAFKAAPLAEGEARNLQRQQVRPCSPVAKGQRGREGRRPSQRVAGERPEAREGSAAQMRTIS